MERYQFRNDPAAIGYFDCLSLFLHHTQYLADAFLEFANPKSFHGTPHTVMFITVLFAKLSLFTSLYTSPNTTFPPRIVACTPFSGIFSAGTLSMSSRSTTASPSLPADSEPLLSSSAPA
jgi:hypothetical protein